MEEENLVDKAIPTSTKYKNKWTDTIFNEYQTVQNVQVHVLDSEGMFKDCHDLSKIWKSLNYWLSKIVLGVAKKSGEKYPPRTGYCIVCGSPTLP